MRIVLVRRGKPTGIDWALAQFRAREAAGLTPMDRAVEPQPHSRVINRGEIFWIAADEAKGAIPGAPHPHVVVQDDVFNHSRISTVVVCTLSSNLHKASEPGNVLLEPGEGGLDRQSVAVTSQVSCVYKSRLGEYIGSLSPARIDQILAGLRFVQEAFHRRR